MICNLRFIAAAGVSADGEVIMAADAQPAAAIAAGTIFRTPAARAAFCHSHIIDCTARVTHSPREPKPCRCAPALASFISIDM